MKKILIAFFSLIFCSTVFASSINEIVFFGDSLTDDGNLYQVLRILPKSPPYYKGRFSNGITWAEHVGNYYYQKSYVNYSNYAYGGATAILHNLRSDPFIAPMLLGTELDGYLLRNPLKDKSKALFGVWIGANDYLYERTEDLNKLTDDVVNKIASSVQILINKGGQNFLLLNLPDLGQTPYARAHDNSERLTTISVMHNKKLADAVNALKTNNPNANIVFYDIYSLFVDILKHPDIYNQKYGTHITDIAQGCWSGTVLGLQDQKVFDKELKEALGDNSVLLDKNINTSLMSKAILSSPSLVDVYQVGKAYDEGKQPCPNADEHLFWDDLHPTAVIHKVLGQIIIDALQNQI